MLISQTVDIVNNFLSQNRKVVLCQFPDFLFEVVTISFQKLIDRFSDLHGILFEGLYSLKCKIHHFANNDLLFASNQEFDSVVYTEISILLCNHLEKLPLVQTTHEFSQGVQRFVVDEFESYGIIQVFLRYFEFLNEGINFFLCEKVIFHIDAICWLQLAEVLAIVQDIFHYLRVDPVKETTSSAFDSVVSRRVGRYHLSRE